MTPLTFTRHNRAPRTIAILICVYGALIALVILFDAAWWLVGLLSLVTLPALWDIAQNTRAGLSLNDNTLSWHSGKRQGQIDLSDVDYFRFDTRWDLSVRVSLVLNTGKRIRLPDESIPPHRAFEDILKQAGFRVDRHHFTIF